MVRTLYVTILVGLGVFYWWWTTLSEFVLRLGVIITLTAVTGWVAYGLGALVYALATKRREWLRRLVRAVPLVMIGVLLIPPLTYLVVNDFYKCEVTLVNTTDQFIRVTISGSSLGIPVAVLPRGVGSVRFKIHGDGDLHATYDVQGQMCTKQITDYAPGAQSSKISLEIP